MNERRGAFFALLAVMLAATTGVSFKLSVTNLDSFAVTVYIGLFATIALFINLIWRGKISEIWPEFRRQPFFYIGAGIIGLGISQIFYMQAYQSMPAARVVFLFYSYPLLMAGFSWLIFKERIGLTSAIILLIGFLGIGLLLLGNGGFSLTGSSGVLITLLAAGLWALFCVLIKHRSFDSEIGMFLFSLFGVLFLVGWMPLQPANYQIGWRELVGLSYLAIFPTALSLLFWNKALHMLKTSICSNLALLTPMLSISLIVLVLKESLSINQLLGFAMVIVSVFLNLKLKAATPVSN